MPQCAQSDPLSLDVSTEAHSPSNRENTVQAPCIGGEANTQMHAMALSVILMPIHSSQLVKLMCLTSQVKPAVAHQHMGWKVRMLEYHQVCLKRKLLQSLCLCAQCPRILTHHMLSHFEIEKAWKGHFCTSCALVSESVLFEDHS